MIPHSKTAGALTLRYLPTDRFKVGQLTLSMVLPIRSDLTPMTTLLLSVLRRGTERYPTLEAVNRRLDYLYGTELAIRNFYRGNLHIIGLCAELLDSSYLPGEDLCGDVLEVVEQMLFHPLTDEHGLLLEKYVESEKKLQCDAIRSLKNNPRVYASERMRELTFANEDCGLPLWGTVEQIEAITPAQLTAHWKALIQTAPIECFYVGSMDPDVLADRLARTVGRAMQPLIERPTLAPIASPIAARAEVQRVDETLEVGQSHLLLSFRSDTIVTMEGQAACAVYTELLGASPVSRLFMHVREKLSLCYSCASAYRPYKGTLRISCGLHRDNRAAAEAEIHAQMQSIADGCFTDAELEAAKKSLLNAMRQADDSPGALESFYFGRSILGSAESIDDYRAAIARVDRAAIVAAARGFTPHTVYFLCGTLSEEEPFDDEE